jgi:DNA helicase-2/ATP-dependent DNA helicase PcrA
MIEGIAKREEEAIMRHCKGPAIVIGGPGSRKTTILAKKLVSLCREDKCNPNRIVAITFTNNAAKEVKKKVEEICKTSDYAPPEIYINTMHSLAKRLLYRYSDRLKLPSSFRVVGKLQEEILLEDARWELKAQKVNLGGYQNRYLRRFKARKASIPDLHLDTIAEIPFKRGLVTQENFDERYSSLLHYYRSVDWYDVVAFVVKLLRENADILNEVAKEIDHLLVDEYQDLNRADQELICLLSTKAGSLMVFGDDDQSIYQTGRFANPGGVKRFREIYPSAKLYPLSVCWRCGSSIIDAAWKLINVVEDQLPERMPKEKPIPNPTRGSGEFKIMVFKSEKAERQALCNEVQNELRKNGRPKDILILFHSKEIGQKYAEVLQTKGFLIENLLGKSQGVSKAILLFYEMLRLVNDESDNLAVRILLKELFRMNPQQVTKARSVSQNQNKSLWQTVIESDHATEKIKFWSENFKRWRRMDGIIEMLNEIIVTTNIHNEPEIQKIVEWCAREDNLTLHKLIDRLEKGFDFEEPTPTETMEESPTRVVVMTMHGAKGLDADIVFVPALENELMPNQWYEPEQRRLLYVSMTRAKSLLFLSWAWSRTGRATYRRSDRAEIHRRRSKFLDEIER